MQEKGHAQDNYFDLDPTEDEEWFKIQTFHLSTAHSAPSLISNCQSIKFNLEYSSQNDWFNQHQKFNFTRLHGLCNSTLLDICESNLIVGTLTWRETKYQCTPDQEMFVRETGKWKFIRTICTPVLQMFMPTIVFAGTYWWLESSLQYFCNFCFLQSLEVVLARNQQWKHWISLLCCSS